MPKFSKNWVQQALDRGEHPFFIQMPAEVTQDAQGNVTKITGLGSKVERSRTGHKMLSSAIANLNSQSKGNPGFINHDPDQIFGNIVGVRQGALDEYNPVFQMLPKSDNQIADAPRAKIDLWVKNGVKLGLSMGGIVKQFDTVKDKGTGEYTFEISKIEPVETSVTPLPAVTSSDGSVKAVQTVCKDGICGQIAQQIQNGPVMPGPVDENKMIKQSSDPKALLKQSSGYVLNQDAYNNLEAQIQAGNVDHDSPWNLSVYGYSWSKGESQPDLWCLGLDPTDTSNGSYIEAYMYPCGMNGTVFKSAIIAVADQAPVGSDIYAAADKLLAMIYESEETEDDENGTVVTNSTGPVFIQTSKSSYEVNQTCYDFAVKQIKAGNINNGSWSKPAFTDFGSDIDTYKNYALAVDPDGDDTKASSYGFEIGKNDKIFRQGVIAAKKDAAGARSKAGKNQAIYDAADKLLQMIDDEENDDNNSKSDQSIGDESMVDEKAVELMKQKMDQQDKLIQTLVDERDARVKQEAEAEAAKLRKQEIEEIVKQNNEEAQKNLKDALKQNTDTMAEAMSGIVAEMMGNVMKSREGAAVQQSLTPIGGPKPNPAQGQINAQSFQSQLATQGMAPQVGDALKEGVVLAGKEVVPMNQALKDSVHYPAVVHGQAVQGVTPAQMFGAN